MAITKLDDVAALVVVDLQKGIVAWPAVYPASEIIDRAARRARAFRNPGLPVARVNVTGAAPGRTDAAAAKVTRPRDCAELVPELEPQSGYYLVTKQSGSVSRNVAGRIPAHARRTANFIGRLADQLGVESTARSAYNLGGHVVLVTDAMSDRDPAGASAQRRKDIPAVGRVWRDGRCDETVVTRRTVSASVFSFSVCRVVRADISGKRIPG